MNDRLRRSLPLAGALFLALFPLREFLGSRVPVGRDLPFFFYPLKAHLAEAVLRGELPWIDRFRWGGAPLLGGPSAAPFDPANALFLILPLGAAMKAWIVLHLALALAGFAAFSRRLGLSREAAAVAGLVFTLGGIAVSVAPFPPTLSALSLLPWFAAFTFDLVRSPGIRPAAAVAVVAAFILLATAPEFVLYAAFLAIAIVFVAREKGGGVRQTLRPVGALLASALVAAALAAVSVVPGFVAAARSSRSPELGRSFAGGALTPFEMARLPDLAVDGRVADWTVATRAPGVPHYPWLPSVTPGRVAWLLVLAGLFVRGPGRFAAWILVLFGVLLALGDATPAFGIATRLVPPLSWIRYPERHLILAGFGFAWVAALGLSALTRFLSPRGLRIVLPLLAVAVLADREGIARGLVLMDDAAVLERAPALLAPLLPLPEGAPPPRLFYQDLYAPVPVYDTRDLAVSGRVARQSLLPAYASLFGVGYQFEVDYDLSLPMEAYEWERMLARAVPESPALARLFVRGAGVAAVVRTAPDADGRFGPTLERIVDAVPPYRFAARLVASDNAPEVFRRLLKDGFPVDTAYVDEPVPGLSEAPSVGRILSVADRPSALTLEVEVPGPEHGFLMLYRLRDAVEDATLDGRRVSAFRLAFGFAGVDVPPGRHSLRLRPDTRWVKIGSVISLLAALSLAGILVARRRIP